MQSATESIVSKVGKVLVEQLQEISGVGDKVVHLRDELATMNAVLRVISEADQDSVSHIVREWDKQVHDLVYDAEDCTDTYSLRIARPTPRPPNDVAGNQLVFSWAGYLLSRAKRVARYPYVKLVLQRTLAADIKAILARTTTVSERRARYCIDQATLPRAAFLAPVTATSISANALRFADDPDQFVGIREQADDLANKIKGIKAQVHDQRGKKPVHDEDDKRLEVFSIVGFGGLGKTTLAMELCRQLDVDFPCQAQVSVSQAFNVKKDMKGLLVRVLQQILKYEQPGGKQTSMTVVAMGTPSIEGPVDGKKTGTKEVTEGTSTSHGNELQIDQMNVEHLSTNIKELLNRKRCLIVVDDVWSIPVWEAIRIELLDKNCDSRIVVTTRIEAVARVASTSEYFVHHMKPLEPEASKKLFIKRVFGSVENGTCPSELKETMDTILKKCGGLPLAIVSIASLLPTYRSAEGIKTWERVSRSIGSQMESHPTLEGMRQLITLSYDYLPHHLKACMMYLSIFPEDCVIAKDRLLYRWIAEGLVMEKRGLTLLEVAEEYLNELVSRNMIQLEKFEFMDSKLGIVEVEGCRVHDMILEVMVSKSQEYNFVSLVGRQYGVVPHGHGKVRRLSIHDNAHDEQGPKNAEQHHERYAIEAMKLQHVRSLTTFQRDGLHKLFDRLCEFKLLRVLDLEDCKALQDKHMRDVCQLYLLRFLSLRGTNVSRMPRKVGNLEHLETLDVKNTKIKMRLPQTVTKLSKLERLMSNEWLLPRGLQNMKALCEVDTGVLTGDNVEVIQEVGKLPRLHVLSIRISDKKIQSEELKEKLWCELASSLSNTRTLQSLNLESWEYDLSPSTGSVEFLHHVSQPPPLLQYLNLCGSIKQLPEWVSTLTYLTKFGAEWTELDGNQLFRVLCKLPNLQSVKLKRVECKGGELVAGPEHSFPVLRILEVLYCPTLTKLTFEEGSMTKLKTLVLDFHNMEMSLAGVENLEKLKEVKLRGREGNLAMQRAVQQLKTLSTESIQIKVVADWWGGEHHN